MLSKSDYETSCIVGAPVQQVWDLLTDAPAYASWNPEIVGIDGQLAAGARFVVQVRVAGGAVRRLQMRVTAFSAPTHMEWTGGLPWGLFVGRRRFDVEPHASGARFVMRLAMTGPLAPLILRSLGDRQPEIDGFALALQSRLAAPVRS
jgi:uncharacterized protein YndB with AHSA1/START domain